MQDFLSYLNSRLKWIYENHEWLAYSATGPGYHQYPWAISVTSDGLFVVEESTVRRNAKEPFGTLAAAKAWCQNVEDEATTEALQLLRLKWFFIDGWWSAVSKIDDNGDSLDWRSEWQIKVTNKGRFSVSHSSPERDTHKETFATFEEASNWCQELENTLHTQPAKEPVAEAITFDKCSPEVEAAAAKAINEFAEEYKKLGVATKENSLIEETVVVGEIQGVVRNTGNKHWDGQVVYLLEFPDSKSKCHIRSKENGNVTWVDTACLTLPSI